MARIDIRRYSAAELRRLRARGVSKTRRDAPVVDLVWRAARLVMPRSAGKPSVRLRVDRDALDWIRKRGRGHVTCRNAVPRAYVEAHRKSR